jgi:uncharacterized protein (TIGR00255 family)
MFRCVILSEAKNPGFFRLPLLYREGHQRSLARLFAGRVEGAPIAFRTCNATPWSGQVRKPSDLYRRLVRSLRSKTCFATARNRRDVGAKVFAGGFAPFEIFAAIRISHEKILFVDVGEKHKKDDRRMRSMTGFGRAEMTRGGVQVVAEARALNQRFFELKLNLPRGWGEYEAEVRKLAQEVVERGRVEIFIRCVVLKPPRARLRVNDELARLYVAELRRLGRMLNLDGNLSLDAVLQRPEIFQVAEEENDTRAGAELAFEALGRALKALRAERVREGRELKRDFERRVKTIEGALPRIDRLAAESRAAIRASYESRVRELLVVTEVPINEKRLFEEASAAAQHGDISEEMTRLKVHLKAMRPLLGRSGPIGKSIEFLLQEMNREVNTMGAKSQHAAMSQITVEIKGELEKMREQVQNVE